MRIVLAVVVTLLVVAQSFGMWYLWKLSTDIVDYCDDIRRELQDVQEGIHTVAEMVANLGKDDDYFNRN